MNAFPTWMHHKSDRFALILKVTLKSPFAHLEKVRLIFLSLQFVMFLYEKRSCPVSHLANNISLYPFSIAISSDSTHFVRVDWMKSLASSDRSCGNEGSVGCVAILNKAAIGSNSDHGGLVVSISTTVQPRLLQMADRMKILLNVLVTFHISYLWRILFFIKSFVIRSCFLTIVPFELLRWILDVSQGESGPWKRGWTTHQMSAFRP